MKTLEKNLWGWLKRGCRNRFRFDCLFMERVENVAGSGTPDVDLCLNRHVFKFELKTCDRPKREGTRIKVRFQPAQIPWLRAYHAAGGRAYVLIQVGSGSTARRYLIHGHYAATVECGVTEAVLSKLSITQSDDSAADIVLKAYRL
jgi:hypothetical protein